MRKKRNDVKKRNVPSDDSFINDASDVEEPHALTNYHSELTKSIKAEVKSAKKYVLFRICCTTDKFVCQSSIDIS